MPGPPAATTRSPLLPPRRLYGRPFGEHINQPDTSPSLADEFDTVLHSLSTPDPTSDLSGPLTSVLGLTARLASQLHDAHRTLAACAPADRASHATTASELCRAAGAAAQAVNALATAQDAHLFIAHFPNRYGNAEINVPFARVRIDIALATCRSTLTETITSLQSPTHTDHGGQHQHADHARGPQSPANSAPAKPHPPQPEPSAAPSAATARLTPAQETALKAIAAGGVTMRDSGASGPIRLRCPAGARIAVRTFERLRALGLVDRDTTTSLYTGQRLFATATGHARLSAADSSAAPQRPAAPPARSAPPANHSSPSPARPRPTSR